LFGVLAGVAFVACTNDNEPAGVTPVNGGDEVAAVDGYMSLKFAMPGDNATTRADGWTNEDGFLAADADEIAVSGATILFFDGDVQVADPFNTAKYDGTAVGDGATWTPVADGNIDWTHEAVIVLKNAVKNPTSIVAILNALPEGVTVSRSTTMPQLLALAGDFRKADAKNFVMTNSVYLDAKKKAQIGAPVTADNVQKTADLAKANPVTIYVEKVVAKAKLTNGKDTDTGVTTKPKAGETTGKKISVTVDKWWLDNTNPQSFLVKNLATSYTELGNWSGWNDAANFRSYWATAYGITDDTAEHSEYTKGVALDNVIYAQENTNQDIPTQLVVAATLTVEGAKAGTSIVKYLSEVYTAPDFETLLYGMISEKYFTRTATTTEQGTEYDYQPVPQTAYTFTFATNKKDADVTTPDGKKIEDYEALVSVTCNVAVKDLYTYNQETKQGAPVDADAFAADLASIKRKVQ